MSGEDDRRITTYASSGCSFRYDVLGSGVLMWKTGKPTATLAHIRRPAVPLFFGVDFPPPYFFALPPHTIFVSTKETPFLSMCS